MVLIGCAMQWVLHVHAPGVVYVRGRAVRRTYTIDLTAALVLGPVAAWIHSICMVRSYRCPARPARIYQLLAGISTSPASVVVQFKHAAAGLIAPEGECSVPEICCPTLQLTACCMLQHAKPGQVQ
jgi:hypothetical protein